MSYTTAPQTNYSDLSRKAWVHGMGAHVMQAATSLSILKLGDPAIVPQLHRAYWHSYQPMYVIKHWQPAPSVWDEPFGTCMKRPCYNPQATCHPGLY